MVVIRNELLTPQTFAREIIPLRPLRPIVVTAHSGRGVGVGCTGLSSPLMVSRISYRCFWITNAEFVMNAEIVESSATFFPLLFLNNPFVLPYFLI